MEAEPDCRQVPAKLSSRMTNVRATTDPIDDGGIG